MGVELGYQRYKCLVCGRIVTQIIGIEQRNQPFFVAFDPVFYGVFGQAWRSAAKDYFGVSSLLVPFEQLLSKRAKSGPANQLLPVTLHSCENNC
ncbi:hypothetical protein DD985_03790 [Pseudomonas sp. HMWF011]|nr:hypothetical protein BTR19_24215 [Pseudomonas fluorescens]PMY95321.1 hypothetical protein C1X24_25975 [Pseudomonas sp. FW305-124]PTT12843.1 hypothetical protein DBR14_09665 [Pseudomonas sp. HMWF034]PVV77486.1 hypothetical protein DD985_03790 [Pseudomonas sp. HMWF011]TKK42326.1 hypothetical protein PflCFBP13517_07425 [Pseudomonas fluorescens]